MSYLNNQRLYYLAGENVIQDFNNPTPTPLLNRGQSKDHFNDSLNLSHYSRQVQMKEPGYAKEEVPKKTQPLRTNSFQDAPRDLGAEFVRILLEEFKRVRHISTKDPNVLLEFWKQNRKIRQKEELSMSRRSADMNASHMSERVRELHGIAKERDEDVIHTLNLHSQILLQEQNIKKYILDQYRQQKMKEEMEKNAKPKKMSKETLDRLYQAPPAKERPKSAAPPKDTNKKYDKDFVYRLIELYAIEHPKEKDQLSPPRLFKFYQDLSPEKKILKNEGVAKENIDAFFENFNEKYQKAVDINAGKTGYQSYEPKVLLPILKNELAAEDERERRFQDNSNALDILLRQYYEKHRTELKEAEKKKAEENKKREEQEKYKLRQKVTKKEIKTIGIDNLAKPKDHLKRGKTMLFLKKTFPHDKILQRMLIAEFKKNRLLKYPEEYDMYDSEDETDLYRRDELREPFKTVRNEGRALKISDLSKPLNEREKEITEPYKKYLEQAYLDNNLKMEDEVQRRTREQREDKQLDKFIAVNVRNYLQMRKRRFMEKIPTLKEFLIQKYKEMHRAHPEATERRFPHLTYGYSKRLKNNSYPVEFKRYFFLLVRAISRGTKMSHGKNLLPFWAPPSAGSKAYNALNTNVSYNVKVNNLSKETKTKRIEDETEKNTCWQKDEFYSTRLNMMMRFSDAKECTFAPIVGSKMPKAYKNLMEREYTIWAGQYLSSSKASFDEWVKAMGDNFSKRFPTIYKYGKFKRALRFWKEEQYIKAYKELAEAFHIDDIKKHFDPSYQPSKFKSIMFSKESLKVNEDLHRPMENFSDPPNAKFLQDVYILTMFLESHEKDLQKSMKEVEKMVDQDQTTRRSRRGFKGMSKTMMCPLGDKCPADIRPRWPNTNTKTISKFGHKCEYAHHVFELKFEQEIKAKKKMLENTLEELNKKIKTDYPRQPFNPGGGKMTDCIGCGEELRTKGISKGVCSLCQMKKGISKKLEEYRLKADLKYRKITQQDSFLHDYKEKHEFEERMNLKLGYYRKACVLFENQRYKDAFKNISKAVEMVKNEDRVEEEKEQKRSHDLKIQLGIDPSIPLTMDMLYDYGDSNENDKGQELMPGLTKAKVKAYAEKMGYIGEQKVNINEFLNYQIDKMYRKIEKAQLNRMGDIERLQKKIEKLEGFDEEVEEVHAEQNTFGANDSLSAKRRKQKALMPKHKFDINLVSTEKKIANMQRTIQYIREEVEEGQPPEAWKPTRHNNIILDIKEYDTLMSEKKHKKVPGEKSKELTKSSRNFDGSKSIFNRDLDDLVKMPYERSSPTKW